MDLNLRSSITLKLYEIYIKDFEKFVDDIAKSDLITNEFQKGFSNVQVLDENTVSGKFISREAFNVEAANEGMSENTTMELNRFVEAEFLIRDDVLFVTGKNEKQLIYSMSIIAESNIKKIKFNQHEMKLAENTALMIKKVSAKNIPHCEINQLTFSGMIEDIYGFKGIDINSATLTSVFGSYSIDNVNVNLTYNEKGNITIKRPKGKDIDFNLIVNAYELIKSDVE